MTLKRGLPKRGKHQKTTCDVPAGNMSKLSAAQEVVIDSSRSEEDVPTNEEIVSNPLRSVDNTSIDKAQYLIEILYFLMGIVLISFLMGNGLILPWMLQIQRNKSEGKQFQLEDYHELNPMKVTILILIRLIYSLEIISLS